MRHYLSAVLLAAVAAGATLAGQSKPAASHVMVSPAAVKWGPAPAGLPPGAQIAVLDGDPGQAGMFSVRLKFPDGYRVAPHWHPTDENIVVLQGVFRLGVGEKADPAAAHDMTVGTYGKMPGKTPHFAMAKGETIIQLYGQGPFVLNYVNPNDDPRKKTQ